MYGKVIRVLDGAADKLSQAFMAVSMGMLFFMMLLGGGDVIGRYFFNQPVPGAFEITEILLAGIVYFGAAYTQRVKGHATVDFFYGFLPQKVKLLVRFLGTLLVMCIFAMMIWRGTVAAITQWRIHQEIPNIGLPSYLFQLFVPMGALIMGFVLAIELFQFFREPKED